ncbi:hypothetical protein Cgig2_031148 [Carnegiea gigantea]|uniref:Remorin C-terminal domain-containing protein n=1 Tax=Carnegiea gigantea TaxID=171969 RepID=A0A9Q1KR22_9CARY|nr:hypothetical protein Cgig2_031148 [Carnegiea gigantea]
MMIQEDPQKKTKENPFADDPICKLNLRETAEFVKSLPMSNGTQSAQRRREREDGVIGNSMGRRTEAPSTPGRPVFSFSASRRSLPSKWDDAEKWLMGGGSCHESPAHHAFCKTKQIEPFGGSNSKGVREIVCKQQQSQVFAETLRVVDCQLSPSDTSLEDHDQFNGVIVPSDMPLKDKFTDEIGVFVPNSRYSEPTKEAFLFQSQKLQHEPMKDACTEVVPFQEVIKHRDIGTEMTPLGSSTTSRCPTPFMSTSPARHNTPATRSGPLALVAQSSSIDITKQLQECHLAKLQNGSTQFDSVATNWSSREEEEEEISKSLRHFEIGRRSVSVSESRTCAWEEEEKTKSCLRYQREEARIQAWMDLQTAKAEAQSKKLEKMRSDLEEKLMKRMGIVHRKAEEWRAAAQAEHSEQIRRATQRGQKHMLNQKSLFSPHFTSCGCFPCTTSDH